MELSTLKKERTNLEQISCNLKQLDSSQIGNSKTELEQLMTDLNKKIELVSCRINETLNAIGSFPDAVAKKTLKIEDKSQCSNKATYLFVDGRNHYCRVCTSLFPSERTFLKHLITKDHLKRMDKDEKPQKKTETSHTLGTAKADKIISSDFKGSQFLDGLPFSFYCKLCKEFSEDIDAAKRHVRTWIHMENYMKLIKLNPFYEEICQLERRSSQLFSVIKARPEKNSERNSSSRNTDTKKSILKESCQPNDQSNEHTPLISKKTDKSLKDKYIEQKTSHKNTSQVKPVVKEKEPQMTEKKNVQTQSAHANAIKCTASASKNSHQSSCSSVEQTTTVKASNHSSSSSHHHKTSSSDKLCGRSRSKGNEPKTSDKLDNQVMNNEEKASSAKHHSHLKSIEHRSSRTRKSEYQSESKIEESKTSDTKKSENVCRDRKTLLPASKKFESQFKRSNEHESSHLKESSQSLNKTDESKTSDTQKIAVQSKSKTSGHNSSVGEKSTVQSSARTYRHHASDRKRSGTPSISRTCNHSKPVYERSNLKPGNKTCTQNLPLTKTSDDKMKVSNAHDTYKNCDDKLKFKPTVKSESSLSRNKDIKPETAQKGVQDSSNKQEDKEGFVNLVQLTISSVTSHSVLLSWNLLVPSLVRHYLVYYKLVSMEGRSDSTCPLESESSGPWSLAGISKIRTTYLVHSLLPGECYKFRVSALFHSGERRVIALSDKVCTLKEASSDELTQDKVKKVTLQVNAVSQRCVYLTWGPLSIPCYQKASKLQIYRKCPPEGPQQCVATLPLYVTNYCISDLESGKKYEFELKVMYSSGHQLTISKILKLNIKDRKTAKLSESSESTSEKRKQDINLQESTSLQEQVQVATHSDTLPSAAVQNENPIGMVKLYAEIVGTNSVELGWTPANITNLPNHRDLVISCTESKLNWEIAVDLQKDVASCRVENLSPGKRHRFELKACTPSGDRLSISNIICVSTLENESNSTLSRVDLNPGKATDEAFASDFTQQKTDERNSTLNRVDLNPGKAMDEDFALDFTQQKTDESNSTLNRVDLNPGKALDEAFASDFTQQKTDESNCTLNRVDLNPGKAMDEDFASDFTQQKTETDKDQDVSHGRIKASFVTHDKVSLIWNPLKDFQENDLKKVIVQQLRQKTWKTLCELPPSQRSCVTSVFSEDEYVFSVHGVTAKDIKVSVAESVLVNMRKGNVNLDLFPEVDLLLENAEPGYATLKFPEMKFEKEHKPFALLVYQQEVPYGLWQLIGCLECNIRSFKCVELKPGKSYQFFLKAVIKDDVKVRVTKILCVSIPDNSQTNVKNLEEKFTKVNQKENKPGKKDSSAVPVVKGQDDALKLNILKVTSDSILMSWKPCGIIEHYIVKIQSKEDKNWSWLYSLQPDQNVFLAENLLPNKLYRILIQAKTDEYYSDVTRYEDVHTLCEDAQEPVLDTSKDENVLEKLTWNEERVKELLSCEVVESGEMKALPISVDSLLLYWKLFEYYPESFLRKSKLQVSYKNNVWLEVCETSVSQTSHIVKDIKPEVLCRFRIVGETDTGTLVVLTKSLSLEMPLESKAAYFSRQQKENAPERMASPHMEGTSQQNGLSKKTASEHEAAVKERSSSGVEVIRGSTPEDELALIKENPLEEKVSLEMKTVCEEQRQNGNSAQEDICAAIKESGLSGQLPLEDV